MKTLIFSRMAARFLLLAGILCFVSMSAIAQNNHASVNDPTSVAPKGSFLEPSLAIALVDEQLTTLKTQVADLEPGTASYNLVEWKFAYYGAVRSQLGAGKTVSQSIVLGMDLYMHAPYNAVPQSQQTANKNSLITLLEI
jgi:hypothetical protein